MSIIDQQIYEMQQSGEIRIACPSYYIQRDFEKIIKPFYNWDKKYILLHGKRDYTAYIDIVVLDTKSTDTPDEVTAAIELSNITSSLIVPKELRNIIIDIDKIKEYKVITMASGKSILNTQRSIRYAMFMLTYKQMNPSNNILETLERYYMQRIKNEKYYLKMYYNPRISDLLNITFLKDMIDILKIHASINKINISNKLRELETSIEDMARGIPKRNLQKQLKEAIQQIKELIAFIQNQYTGKVQKEN